MSNIKDFIDLSREKVRFSNVMLSIIIMLLILFVLSLEDKIQETRTEYPLLVVVNSIHDLVKEEDIENEILRWKSEKRVAQLSALQLLCNSTFIKLETILIKETQVRICRLVK